ncbi:MAG TPA: glycosyltransferase family 4 protein [Kiloniellales bacterium]|jgi:glycosyltransferase involved in cell wall biosynthesis
MRIAFYAPLKPPSHPVPSGDRRMSRLLLLALRRAGHRVEVASRLRSRDGTGDSARQARVARAGAATAQRLIQRYRKRPAAERPRVWMTYHLYYKAPDWLGPAVSAALGIPYVAVEASVAGKRAEGSWADGHRATLEALAHAAAVIAVNPADVAALPDPGRVHLLPPFLDPAPFRAAVQARESNRAAFAKQLGIAAAPPWLLAVAMMRPGDKLTSYRQLATALAGLADRPWRLLIAGDGAARPEVERAFAWAPPERVQFLGALPGAALPALYAACDVLVWPAHNEAYGMALLEAQAAGLPVLAGASGGVAAIVRDGRTGVLTPPGDTNAFAAALDGLLADPARRRTMAEAAEATVAAAHGIDRAAARLDEILNRVTAP